MASPTRRSWMLLAALPVALCVPWGAAGPVVTLQPGQSVEIVLWYALPEGDPPLDILYVEPDRTVLVGPTFTPPAPAAGRGSG